MRPGLDIKSLGIGPLDIAERFGHPVPDDWLDDPSLERFGDQTQGFDQSENLDEVADQLRADIAGRARAPA